MLAEERRLPTVCQRQCCRGGVGEGLPSGTGGAWKKRARSLILTQSGVELRLCVKCRGAEDVCKKCGLLIGWVSDLLWRVRYQPNSCVLIC